MRKKSKKLLDMALRELHTAIKEGKEEVEITLEKDSSGTKEAAQCVSDKYEIKKLTELIRKEFAAYEVKSVIYTEILFGAFCIFLINYNYKSKDSKDKIKERHSDKLSVFEGLKFVQHLFDKHSGD